MMIKKFAAAFIIVLGVAHASIAAKIISAKLWYTGNSSPNCEIIIQEEKGDLRGKEGEVRVTIRDELEQLFPNMKWPYYHDGQRLYDSDGEKLDIYFMSGNEKKEELEWKPRHRIHRKQGNKYIITLKGGDIIICDSKTGTKARDPKYYYKPNKLALSITVKPHPAKSRNTLDEDFSYDNKEIDLGGYLIYNPPSFIKD